MASKPASPPKLWQRLSTFLFLRPALSLGLLLAPPLLWLGVVYLGSLFTLLLNSFFRLDDFSGVIVREFTLATYAQLFTRANLDIIIRTTVMAAAVTLACAVIAFPLSYYIARHAPSRLKAFMYLAVLLPLWSSYLVRVYSWRLILAKEGIISWFFGQACINPDWWNRFLNPNLVGEAGPVCLQTALDWVLSLPNIGGPSLSFSPLGMFLVFVYIWLPYMILPIQAALERVPKTLIEASADLGARPGETFRNVIFPLAFPGVVAGSIFTFSLTLGDYIIPSVIGNSSFFIGAVVLSHQGTSGNIPLAAAFTVVPMAIMAVYLVVAKRLGAFEAL